MKIWMRMILMQPVQEQKVNNVDGRYEADDLTELKQTTKEKKKKGIREELKKLWNNYELELVNI